MVSCLNFATGFSTSSVLSTHLDLEGQGVLENLVDLAEFPSPLIVSSVRIIHRLLSTPEPRAVLNTVFTVVTPIVTEVIG